MPGKRNNRRNIKENKELIIADLDENKEETEATVEETEVTIKEPSGVEEMDYEDEAAASWLSDSVLSIKEIGKYFVIFAAAITYWELIMGLRLGAMSAFFLFFLPAQALFFTVFAGIYNKLTARITLPLLLAIPAIYYIVQSVYLTNFGSLFSISMTGMGGDALNDFGWALIDSIIKSIPSMILILLPVAVAVFFAVKDVCDFNSYKVYIRPIVLAAACLLWLFAALFIRVFGTERLTPYYYMTSLQATTDATAKKLGCLTTGLVESGSYFLGLGSEEDMEFAMEEEFTLDTAANDNDTIVVADNIEAEDSDNVEENSVETRAWVLEGLDFDKVEAEAADEETRSLAGFFKNRQPSTSNEYTGMFEGYNLIYICAESFWNYACNEEITPTLYKMANNGIVLNNYYNSFYNTTTNGEFAFTTSLWPDVSRHSSNGTDIGSFAQSASKFMPQGLGDLFTAQGIPSYAFHNYYGKYYRRILSWPNLGYKCKFTGDGMYFTFNWPASDLELMQQSVDDYINEDQFNAYYMTFSGHGPFTAKNQMFNKNIGEVTGILGTDKYHVDARGYFAGELELDKAMEYLLKRLEEAGKLDNTVIVIAADHYPYYLSDDGRKSLAGYDIDQDFDIYKSSCIIYNAGMHEPLQVDNYCSNVDIAPTILNLFNIPYDSRIMAGRDIFSDQAHNRAVLYNMSFITDRVRYNYDNGEAVWTPLGDELSIEDKDRYISSQLASIENEYKASCAVIDDNFFFKAYQICGLISPDDAAAEEVREAKVRSEDANYNEQDEIEKAEREAEKELQKQLEEQAAAAAALEELKQEGVATPDGNVVLPDGRIILPNGTIVNTDGTVTTIGGNENAGNDETDDTGENAIAPDTPVTAPLGNGEAAAADPNAAVVAPNAAVQMPNTDTIVVFPAVN